MKDYNFFLFTELSKLYRNDLSQDGYDTLFEQLVKDYNEFLGSSEDDPNKPLYECIESWLQSKYRSGLKPAKKSEPPTVLIVVEGGLVRDVHSTSNIQYIVMDTDMDELDGTTSLQGIYEPDSIVDGIDGIADILKENWDEDLNEIL